MPASQQALARLQMWQTAIAAFIIAFAVSISSVMIYEVRTLHSHQQEVKELTLDLCQTLERAGILIRGSGANPCGD